ncbi:MAG: hypothetical protein Tsb008_05090 [Rhodothalassiaceae bacterium]
MDSESWIYGEPTLDELLSDPLMAQILKRDGLSTFELRRQMLAVASRLPRGRGHNELGLSPAA